MDQLRRRLLPEARETQSPHGEALANPGREFAQEQVPVPTIATGPEVAPLDLARSSVPQLLPYDISMNRLIIAISRKSYGYASLEIPESQRSKSSAKKLRHGMKRGELMSSTQYLIADQPGCTVGAALQTRQVFCLPHAEAFLPGHGNRWLEPAALIWGGTTVATALDNFGSIPGLGGVQRQNGVPEIGGCMGGLYNKMRKTAIGQQKVVDPMRLSKGSQRNINREHLVPHKK
ncbi:UNVERIFIED_CONTAM: hypothetical protein K2H54_058346 [Gekko kuhli]